MSKEAFVLPRRALIEAKFIPEETEGRALYAKINSIVELYRLLKLAKNKGEYCQRDGEKGVEQDPSVQQLIMYGFVMRRDRRFLLYQRGSEENYDESRLAGKVSMGIGGHMEPTDLSLGRSFYRELNEEAEVLVDGKPVNFYNPDDSLDVRKMKQYVRVAPVGLIKDEQDEVGKVHFGVACRLTPQSDNVEIAIRTESEENISSRYVTVEEYLQLKTAQQITPEGWTDIVFNEEILSNS